jgi:hypothetical protein
MEITNTNEAKSSSAAFFALVNNPFKFRLFLLKNLPAAYFAGVRLKSTTEERAMVSVPYKWFTRNPFRCTYFACLSMAAEMSTGILALGNIYKRSPKVSMLVTAIEGKFYKRATDLTRFICDEGIIMKQTIETAIVNGEPQNVKVLSSGFNQQNELVAEFWVTWSFKAKQQ